jgi:DNA modification methylase
MEIENIIKKVNSYRLTIDNVGLFEGRIGLAIFFFAYYRYSDNPEYEMKAFNLIEETFDLINSNCSIDYANGLSGISAGITYLLTEGFIFNNEDDILEDIDMVITNKIIYSKTSDCSIESGLTGWGKYFSQRIMNAKSTNYPAILYDKITLIDIIDRLFIYKEFISGKENDVISFLYDVYSINIINFKVEQLLSYLFSENNTDNNFLLQKAFIVKQYMKESYLNHYHSLFQENKFGLKSGYLGLGMTCLMNHGIISDTWLQLL